MNINLICGDLLRIRTILSPASLVPHYVDATTFSRPVRPNFRPYQLEASCERRPIQSIRYYYTSTIIACYFVNYFEARLNVVERHDKKKIRTKGFTPPNAK